ncbi:MAG: hypothetical protein IT355_15965 [Gemmatimonadaceae bacterium]|nr:hypothetical protein [Gemmatimonadaceae bacterium]
MYRVATNGEHAVIASRAKGQIATWHRWLGLGLTVPLLGWIISAAVMMLVSMNAPNGLAGIYALNPYNSVDVRLDAATVDPNTILQQLSSVHHLERIYWLRLQSRGPHLWYVVKPTPFALAMVFDARTGERLDPLPDSLLATVAGEALVGARVVKLESATEYNRYYTVDRLPVVRAHVDGQQEARLILSRDEGRTLRRLNAESERFEWWYRAAHVNQFSAHMGLWTTLLYLCGAAVIVTSVFGYMLFWWRRPRAPAATQVEQAGRPWMRARNLHRKLGVVAGGILAIQMLVGAYLWLSLGPLEDPFRGKTSFSTDWQGGFSTQQSVATPNEVLSRVAASLPPSPRPVQAIEWWRLGEQDAWAITTRMDEPTRVVTASGVSMQSLTAALAGEIARQEVVGHPPFVLVGASTQLSTDLNRVLPVYRFRFDDPQRTDVYVSNTTGQVIQRRPFFWRMFGPFLAVHMFSFTGNKTFDVILLASFQLLVLGMIASGWRVRFPGKTSREA